MALTIIAFIVIVVGAPLGVWAIKRAARETAREVAAEPARPPTEADIIDSVNWTWRGRRHDPPYDWATERFAEAFVGSGRGKAIRG